MAASPFDSLARLLKPEAKPRTLATPVTGTPLAGLLSAMPLGAGRPLPGAPLGTVSAGDTAVGTPSPDILAAYRAISSLPEEVQYAVYSQLSNQGPLNSANLRDAFVQQRFGGNAQAFNDWLNRTAYGGGNTATFDPTTGRYSYYTIDPTAGAQLQSGAIAGWGAPTPATPAVPPTTQTPGAQPPPVAEPPPAPENTQTPVGYQPDPAPEMQRSPASIHYVGRGYNPAGVADADPTLYPTTAPATPTPAPFGNGQQSSMQKLAQTMAGPAAPRWDSPLQSGGAVSPGTPLAGPPRFKGFRGFKPLG